MKSQLFYTFKSVYVIAILLTSTMCLAQDDYRKNQFMDNVTFGGGLGLNFGNGGFGITVAPSALYNFNDFVSVGPSLIYGYQSNGSFKSSLYGGSVIGIFNPFRQLQLSTEFEQLRVNQTLETADGDIDDDFWNSAFFVGAGFRANNMVIGLRYNLLFKDGNGVYTDALAPFFRVYF